MADITNTELVTKINQVSDSYRDKAESSLQDLLTLANEKLWNTMGTATANIDRAREISLGALTDLPTARPKVNVPAFTFNPEDYLTSDLLARYSYDSDFFDNFLDTRLREYIDSEALFLAQDVQDALFNQARDRGLQVLNDALDATDRLQAQTGFPIPTSMTFAARAEVIKQYQDRRSDQNREFTALIADKALDEKKHAIDAGIRMEDIRSRFQLAYGQLYFNVAEYLVRKYQADVQAEVSRVNAELEQLKLKAQIDLGMVSSDANWNNTLMENLQLQLNRIIRDAENDREIQKAQAQMQLDALEKIIDYYQTTSSAYVGQMNGVNLVSTTA